MYQIDKELPRKDGVAYFNRLYLQVTNAIRSASATLTFSDPRFVERLDVVFANIYFDAEATIAASARCPVAWRPLIEQRRDARAPIQFALAGMSAHINHDLPLALVQTWEEFAIAPSDASPQHGDFERVNTILQTVQGEVAKWFETGLIADIEEVTPKDVDYALATWSIAAARELAWEHAELLWRLRDQPALADAYVGTLARLVELSGRAALI